MSLASLQFNNSEIRKSRYESLSKVSLNEFTLHEEEHIGFLHEYCDKYLGYEFTIRKDVNMLDGSTADVKDEPLNSAWLNLSLENVGFHLKDIPLASVDLLRGAFDPFDYKKESLSILDLLSDKGVAFFYIPSGVYKDISKDLKKHKFYINAIFGEYDSRDSDDFTDQVNTIPLYCKYIALFISRVKTKHLFIWSELSILSSGAGHFDTHGESFNKVLLNKSRLTKKNIIYKKMLTGHEPIIYSSSKFHGIEHFYLTEKKYSIENVSYSKLNKICLSEALNEMLDYPSYIVLALEHYKYKDNHYYFDQDGFESSITELNSIDEFQENYKKLEKNKDKEMPELSEEMISLELALKKETRALGYKRNEVLELVNNALIIETVNVNYLPPHIDIHHPKDWLWGEYKNWQWSDKERQVSFVQIDNSGPLTQLDFLLHYLRSEEGWIQTKIAALSSNNVFDAWKDIKIPLPSIEEQETIVSALNNTKSIKTKVNQLEQKLIQNPLNAIETDIELKEMITRLEMLSESDQIAQWINRRGNETDQIEFKQTLRLDIKTQTSETRLETTALKTIVGFINNNGGYLIIGVSDDSQVTGMEDELSKFHKSSHDKFKIFFGDKVGQRIGKEFLNNISYKFIAVSGKYVFQVKCTKSKSKCFLDGKDYYVRRHAYTEKLSGPELVKYIEEHYDPENWER